PKDLPPQAELVRGDVRNAVDVAEAIRGVDAVIHLAATGGFTPAYARFLDTNALGTATLLEVLRERRQPIRKVVVASSVGIYGEGQQTRDFVFVGDVAEANALVLEHPQANGQVYNVGTGRPTTIREVAETLGRLLGKEVAPEMTSRYRPGDARHIVADISRLK